MQSLQKSSFIIGVLFAVSWFAFPVHAEESGFISSTDPLEVVARETIVTLKGKGFGESYQKGKDQLCLGTFCIRDDFIDPLIVSWQNEEVKLKLFYVESPDSLAISIVKWRALAADNTPIREILRSAPVLVRPQKNPEISSIFPMTVIPGQTVITITGSGFESEFKAGQHQICFQQDENVFCLKDENRASYLQSWSGTAVKIIAPLFIQQFTSPKIGLRLLFPNIGSYQLVTFQTPLTVQFVPFVEQYYLTMRNGENYTIKGQYFGPAKGRLFIGSAEADVQEWTLSSITFVAPDVSGSVSLIIETADGVRSPPLAVEVIFSKRFSSDPFSSHQTYFEDIGLFEAWNVTEGSPDIVVAVIDSGVDHQHEDLYGSFWINPKEIAGNGFDDDRNGYVDDVSGWDFVSNSNNEIPVNEHGTMVASIIAAKRNNKVGFAGVAPQVKIMGLNVTSKTGATAKEDKVNVTAVLNAIKYAVDNGAHIINLSISGTSSSLYTTALEYAYQNNVLVVVSSGNDHKDLDQLLVSPVCNDAQVNAVIGVASVTEGKKLTSFSNYGKECIDVVAPGIDILAATPNNGYSKAGGTSFSAPIVAGALALLKSAHPDWNIEEIKSVLLSTAENIDAVNPDFPKKLGKGLIKLHSALKAPRPTVSYQYSPRKDLVIAQTNMEISAEKPVTKPLQEEVMVKNPEAEGEKMSSEISPQKQEPEKKLSKAEVRKQQKREVKKKREEERKKKLEARKKKLEERKKRQESLKAKRNVKQKA